MAKQSFWERMFQLAGEVAPPSQHEPLAQKLINLPGQANGAVPGALLGAGRVDPMVPNSLASQLLGAPAVEPLSQREQRIINADASERARRGSLAWSRNALTQRLQRSGTRVTPDLEKFLDSVLYTHLQVKDINGGLSPISPIAPSGTDRQAVIRQQDLDYIWNQLNSGEAGWKQLHDDVDAFRHRRMQLSIQRHPDGGQGIDQLLAAAQSGDPWATARLAERNQAISQHDQAVRDAGQIQNPNFSGMGAVIDELAMLGPVGGLMRTAGVKDLSDASNRAVASGVPARIGQGLQDLAGNMGAAAPEFFRIPARGLDAVLGTNTEKAVDWASGGMRDFERSATRGFLSAGVDAVAIPALLGSQGFKDLSNVVAQARDAGAAPGDNWANKIGNGIGSLVFYAIPGMALARTGGLLANAPKIGRMVMALTQATGEALGNASGSFQDARAQGVPVEEARGRAARGVVADVAFSYILNRLGIYGDESKPILKALKSAVSEGAQEGGQETISQYVESGKVNPWTQRVGEASALGAILGPIGGLGAMALEGDGAAQRMTPDEQAVIQRSIEALAQQVGQPFQRFTAQELEARFSQEPDSMTQGAIDLTKLQERPKADPVQRQSPAQQYATVRDSAGDTFHEARLSPEDIGVYPGLQFKRVGIRGESGTGAWVDTVGSYDQGTAGPLSVWESKDGQYYVINGHHRLQIAKNVGEESVPVRIYRESDGVSFIAAKVKGAIQNLLDGKGTPLDYAFVLSEGGITAQQLEAMGVPAGNQMVKDAMSFMGLNKEQLRFIEDGRIPQPVAAAIAEVGLSEAATTSVMKRAIDAEVDSRSIATGMAEIAKRMGLITRGTKSSQGSMFDDVEDFDEVPLAEAASIENYVKNAIRRNEKLYRDMIRGNAVGDTQVDTQSQDTAARFMREISTKIGYSREAQRLVEEGARRLAETEDTRLVKEYGDKIIQSLITEYDTEGASGVQQRVPATVSGSQGSQGSGRKLAQQPEAQRQPEPVKPAEDIGPYEKWRKEQDALESEIAKSAWGDGGRSMSQQREPGQYPIVTNHLNAVVAGIVEAANAGKPVAITTHTHHTVLSNPGAVRVSPDGIELQIARGREWDSLTDSQVQSLEGQLNIKRPAGYEQQFREAISARAARDVDRRNTERQAKDQEQIDKLNNVKAQLDQILRTGKTLEGETLTQRQRSDAEKALEEVKKSIGDRESEQKDDLATQSAKEPWQLKKRDAYDYLKDLIAQAESHADSVMESSGLRQWTTNYAGMEQKLLDSIKKLQGRMDKSSGLGDDYGRMVRERSALEAKLKEVRSGKSKAEPDNARFRDARAKEIVDWLNTRIPGIAKINPNNLYGFSGDGNYSDYSLNHKDAVRNALREGKPVPAEVLADYPDLQKQSGHTKRGEVGMRVAEGETYITSSGRETTPVPKFAKGAGAISRTMYAVHDWLIQNALLEAEARGDEFNALQFKNEKRQKGHDYPQATKDAAEEYLFGGNEPQAESAPQSEATVKSETPQQTEAAPTYGDWYVTPDGHFGQMRGGNGERVAIYDVHGKFVGRYNRSELKLQTMEPRTATQSDAISQDLARVSKQVADLEATNKTLLLDAGIRDRFEKGLADGTVSQEQYDKAVANGTIMSDADYAKAQAVRAEIASVKASFGVKPSGIQNPGASGENSIGQRRAEAGGETGLDGIFYPAGAFMPQEAYDPNYTGPPSEKSGRSGDGTRLGGEHAAASSNSGSAVIGGSQADQDVLNAIQPESAEVVEPPSADFTDQLNALGLAITKGETKNGKPVWNVSGNTFGIKDLLKNQFGARWYGPEKSWSIYREEDPTPQILAALSEAGIESSSAIKDAGNRGGIDEVERIGELRTREDGRSDERGSRSDAINAVSKETQALIENGLKYGIPESVVADQIEDIGLAIKAYESGKGLFTLANEAGTGKTFVLGGLIRELKARGADNVLYVTMNQDLIAQIQKDLGQYGVDHVTFTTYSALSGAAVSGAFDIVIFDEAHNVKNDTSNRGKQASGLMASAKFTVLASATPFENPVQAGYLAPTKVFNSVGGFLDWVKAYGAAVRVRKYVDYRTGQQVIEEIPYWPGRKPVDAAKAREWFFKQGMMTQRPMGLPPNMVETEFSKVSADPKWTEVYNDVMDVYKSALSSLDLGESDGDGFSGKADAMLNAQISMHMVNTTKRILEAAKLEQGIQRAKDRLSSVNENGDPYNVVIFVETKAERTLGKFRKSGDPNGPLYAYPEIERMMSDWQHDANVARQMQEKAPPPPFADFIVRIAQAYHEAGFDAIELPSTEDEIVNALGGKDKVAVYTGNATAAQATKDKAAFLAGKKRVLVATMAKGGTGLSLHDTVGNRPTAQVNINFPWTATQVDQVSGRVARYGLQSKAQIDWLLADNIPFERDLANRVGGRMADMGATVKGIDVRAANILRGDWDFEGAISVKQLRGEDAIDTNASPDDIYTEADRLEQFRTKPRDTSHGFFETPFPIAALMTKIAGPKTGDRVLEPSAGTGNLIRFLPKDVVINAVELRHDNANALKANVEKWGLDARIESGKDFLSAGELPSSVKDGFDIVLMNPPFEQAKGIGSLDVAHVMKAYDMTKDGGRLVAILGEGPFFRTNRMDNDFRQFLDDAGATVIQLPEDTFKKSGTGVRARMIVIDKGSGRGRTDLNLRDMDGDSLREIERMIPPKVDSKPELEGMDANRSQRARPAVPRESGNQGGFDPGDMSILASPSGVKGIPFTTRKIEEERPIKKLDQIGIDLEKVFPRSVKGAAPKGFLGAYLPASNGRYVRMGSDVRTMTHELGHALDFTYGILDNVSQSDLRKIDVELNTPEYAQTIPEGASIEYERSERFAEWLLHYTLDPMGATKQAPTLTEYFEKEVPKVALDAIDELGKDIGNLANNPTEIIGAGFKDPDARQTVKDTAMQWLEKNIPALFKSNRVAPGFGEYHTSQSDLWRFAFTDAYAPIASLAKEAARRTKGPALSPVDNPEMWMRMLPYMDQIVTSLLTGKVTDLYLEDTGARFSDILEPLRGKEFKTHLKNLRDFMAAERHIHYRNKTLDQLQSDIEYEHQRANDEIEDRVSSRANVLKSIVDAYPEGKARRDAQKRADALIADYQVKLEKRVQRRLVNRIKYLRDQADSRIWGAGFIQSGGILDPSNVAFSKLAEFTDAQKVLYRTSADAYRAMGDAALLMLEQSGKLTSEQRDIIREENPFWYSAMRDMSVDGELLTFQGLRALGRGKQTVHEFKGSSRMQNDPIANLMESFFNTVQEAHRNKMMNTLVTLAENAPGSFDLAQNVTNIDHKGIRAEQLFKVWRNGEQEVWYFPDKHVANSLGNAFKGLGGVPDPVGVYGFLIKASGAPLLRAAVTYSPAFATRNLIRDTVERYMVADYGNNPLDVFVQQSRESKDMYDRLALGYGRSEVLGSQSDWNKARAKAIQQLKLDQNEIIIRPSQLWDTYASLLEKAEQKSRRIIYDKTKKALMDQGMSETNAKYQAADEARSTMIDFRRSGAALKWVSPFIPFLNAQFQGGAAFWTRAGKNPGRTIIRFAVYAMLGMAIERMWNGLIGAEDDRQKLPIHQRDLFWNFKNPAGPGWIRIPKGHTVGAFIAMIDHTFDATAAMSKAATATDETDADMQRSVARHSFDGVFRQAVNSLSPVDESSLYPPLIRVIMEIQTNHDLFTGKSIVPDSEKDLALDLRKQRGVSPLGKIIGAQMNKDGRIIDHMIEASLGYIGQHITDTSRIGTSSLGVQADTLQAASRLSGITARSWPFGSEPVAYVSSVAAAHRAVDPFKALRAEYYAATTEAKREDVTRRTIQKAERLRAVIDKIKGRNLAPAARADAIRGLMRGA